MKYATVLAVLALVGCSHGSHVVSPAPTPFDNAWQLAEAQSMIDKQAWRESLEISDDRRACRNYGGPALEMASQEGFIGSDEGEGRGGLMTDPLVPSAQFYYQSNLYFVIFCKNATLHTEYVPERKHQ